MGTHLADIIYIYIYPHTLEFSQYSQTANTTKISSSTPHRLWIHLLQSDSQKITLYYDFKYAFS